MQSAARAARPVRAPRRRPSRGLALLVVLAAGILAVFAGAALSELSLGEIGFERGLPVVLLGEGLLYLLVLGGGAVAAPILFTAWLLGLGYRAGLAAALHLVAPAPGAADLFEGWEYYYVSYWPAVVAQVLLVAIALRLVRPAIATRRRLRPRPPRSAVRAPQPPVMAESREELLAVLVEAPDAPPHSTTVLEERQIGDLAELPTESPEPAASSGTADVALPLLEEADAAQAQDQTPAGGQPREPSGLAAASPGDTDLLEPVPPPPEPAPVGSLQRMVDTVVAQTRADDIEIRVWRTADRRTLLAGMPAGTNATAVAPVAEALVCSYLWLCRALATRPQALLLTGTDTGACGLRALDPGGGMLLLLASTTPDAATRLPGGIDEVVAAVGDIAALVDEAVADIAPPPLPVLSPDPALTQALAQAVVLDPLLPHDWSAWQDEQRRWYALGATGIEDNAAAAAALAALMPEVERTLSALALGVPAWVALLAPQFLLTACPDRLKGELGIIAALTPAVAPPEEIAQRLRAVLEEVPQ